MEFFSGLVFIMNMIDAFHGMGEMAVLRGHDVIKALHFIRGSAEHVHQGFLGGEGFEF